MELNRDNTFGHNMLQILICLSQLLNCFLGLITNRKAYADESTSSYSFRARENSKFYKCLSKVIDIIFFFDRVVEFTPIVENGIEVGMKDRMMYHCEISYRGELKQKQVAPSMRDVKGVVE